METKTQTETKVESGLWSEEIVNRKEHVQIKLAELGIRFIWFDEEDEDQQYMYNRRFDSAVGEIMMDLLKCLEAPDPTGCTDECSHLKLMLRLVTTGPYAGTPVLYYSPECLTHGIREEKEEGAGQVKESVDEK